MVEAQTSSDGKEKNDLGLERFKWWTIECFASVIVISSYYSEFVDSTVEISSRDYWIFYSGIASTILSVLGFIVCVFATKNRSVSRVVFESILVWCNVILWSTTTLVAIIGQNWSHTEKTLYSNNQFATFHPNVYYFSLWGWAASILLVSKWSKEFVNRGTEWTCTTEWILLAAMGFFTMSSAFFFRDGTVFAEFTNSTKHNITKRDLIHAASMNDLTIGNGTISNGTTENLTAGVTMILKLTDDYLAHGDPNKRGTTYTIQTVFGAMIEAGVVEAISPCDTTVYSCFLIDYAIGLSAATAVVACLIAPMSGSKRSCQSDVIICLFLFWLISLFKLTVSPGPAPRAGNLYFGIYACYFLVLDIFITTCTCRTPRKNQKNKSASDIEENEPVERGELWQAAYGKLERNKEEKSYRRNSYESLFEPPDTWDDWEEAHDDQTHSFSFQLKRSSGSRWGRHTMHSKSSFDVTRFFSDKVYAEPKDWDRCVIRLWLWCVLLTMAIGLIHSISQYETGIELYIIGSTSIVASSIGIVTCLRSSKFSSIVQIVSIIAEFLILLYGAFTYIVNYEYRVFGYSSPEEHVNLFLGKKVQNLENDPNVFFCMAISLVTGILLVTNRCKASLITTDWILFAAVSASLFISSMRIINNINGVGNFESFFPSCNTEHSALCKDATLTQYLATISLCLSMLMTPLFRLGPVLHVVVSIPLIILWGWGLFDGTLTTSTSTHAFEFFAYWGGIFLSLEIASINIINLLRKREKEREILHENENEKDDGIDLSAEIKERSTLSNENENRISDLFLGNLAQSNVASNSQDSDGCSSEGLLESNPDDNQHRNDGIKENDSNGSSQACKELSNFQDRDSCSSERLVESSPGDNQDRNDGIQVNSFKDSSQLCIEASNFQDSDSCSTEGLVETNPDDNQYRNDGIELNNSKYSSQSCKEVSSFQDRDSCSSERLVESSPDGNQDRNDGIEDTRSSQLHTEESLSYADANQHHEVSSVDTEDFVDCDQFEAFSPQFHSTRSTMDIEEML